MDRQIRTDRELHLYGQCGRVWWSDPEFRGRSFSLIAPLPGTLAARYRRRNLAFRDQLTSSQNTIVAANTGGTEPDVFGPFSSDGYNFIGVFDGHSGFGNPGLTIRWAPLRIRLIRTLDRSSTTAAALRRWRPCSAALSLTRENRISREAISISVEFRDRPIKPGSSMLPMETGAISVR